jgi:hypothetical protein
MIFVSNWILRIRIYRLCAEMTSAGMTMYLILVAGTNSKSIPLFPQPE